MKICLLTAFLFVAMSAHATYQQAPNSLSTSEAGSYSTITDDSVTALINEYSPAASSAASLALSGCSVGMSAQTDDGGIAFGSVAQICKDEKILMIVGTKMVASISAAEKERELARGCRTSNPKLYEEHLARAHTHMLYVMELHKTEESLFKKMVADVNATRKSSRWADLAKNAITIGIAVVLFIYTGGLVL